MTRLPLFPLSRRAALKAGAAGLGGLAVSKTGGGAEPSAAKESALAVFELPMGAAPPPLTSDHFPTRVHELVWRNWQLVPVERLAAVAGTDVAEITRIGRALGLGAPPQIPAEMIERAFITIMHHNWHLLPYSQLLELLGWSKERLAVTLAEDTFLFHKLGSLKPDCQPVRHRPADEEIRRREAAIAAIVRKEFPDLGSPPREDLFDFVAALSRAPEAPAPRPAARPLLLCHSPFASYGDPFLDGGPDPCPDGLMERMAAAGVNGLWLHAILPLLAGCPWLPERAGPHERRLANLQSLVARAKRHGLDVFLWLNEPRGLPTAFFRERPDLRGVEERELAALCTSVPEVQDFLRDSVATVCRGVPDLGGFFTITGSENLTNCWSHGKGRDCPRCAAREPAAVVAEVNSLFLEGIRRAGSSAQLIVWDWGWGDAWTEDAIMPQQPVGRISTSCPCGSERMSFVASRLARAFWWQWPWSRMRRRAGMNEAGPIRPRFASRARNSSMSSVRPASRRAREANSSGTRSGYSSRKPRITEGSMPTRGASSVTTGSSHSTLRVTSTLASRTSPFESWARPLSACRGIRQSWLPTLNRLPSARAVPP